MGDGARTAQCGSVPHRTRHDARIPHYYVPHDRSGQYPGVVERAVPGPGYEIAGRYKLVRQLGQGGMGAVWLASHRTLSSPVAIKLIDANIAESPEAIARFQREAKAAAQIRSTHVVQILDSGVDAGVPFIAMELLQGESLADRIERGPLSPSDTAGILSQVARAMTKAHEANIVHRDLKPDNIFLVKEDDTEVAKVLDFGIAKVLTNESASLTRAGTLMGTLLYMSPEQMEGKRVDYRTDLWSLGVIAYECLTGRRPFGGATVAELSLNICARPPPVPSSVANVPPAFDTWFAHAVSREVGSRFQSARELSNSLTSAVEPMDLALAPTARGLNTDVEPSTEESPERAAEPRQPQPPRVAQAMTAAAPEPPKASTTGPVAGSNRRKPQQPKNKRRMLWGIGIALAALGAAAAAVFVLPTSSGSIMVMAVGTDSRLITTATVYVDDRQGCAAAPCKVVGLTEGAYAIRVVADGYEEGTRAIAVVSGQEALVNITLREVEKPPAATAKPEKLTATIVLGNNADGADVFVVKDDERRQIRKFPANLTFEVGDSWSLEASKKGYEKLAVPLEFPDGVGEKTFRVDFRSPLQRPAVAGRTTRAAKSVPKPRKRDEPAPQDPPNALEKVDCSPPYYLDSNGVKKPKPRCL